MKPNIHVIYIADGFADDCDDLIQRCLQTGTVNYQIFCNIWKDSKFALNFQGRASGAEIAEMSEEFIYVAKRYMVRNTSNFEESVAGLFLVYALLHTQPYINFAKLRITPKDLSAIKVIQEVARAQKRYDVLYIMGSLLIEGPIEYHLCEREYGLESAVKKGFTLSSSIDSKGVRPKGVFYRQNDELDLVRELACLERRYFTAKGFIHGTYKPDKTLDYVDDTMASDMMKSLKELINGRDYEGKLIIRFANETTKNIQLEVDGPRQTSFKLVGTKTDDRIETTRHRGDDMQTIKQRAMRGTVGELKHLKSAGSSSQIEECLPQPTTSNDGESLCLSIQPSEPKTSKRQYKKTQPCWKKKKKCTLDLDSNSDIYDNINMPDLTDDTESVILENRTEEADTISNNNNNVDKTQNDIRVGIDLSLVPLELDSEYVGNSYIEIEIIDEYKSGGENTIKCEEITRTAGDGDKVPDKNNKTKKGKGCGKKSKPVDTKLGYTHKGSQNNENVTVSTKSEPASEKYRNIDTSKQKDEDTKSTQKDLENEESKFRNGKCILKLDKLLDLNTDKSRKIQERKNLKKTILKSKLKRLGILPVADMNDPVTENNTKKKRKPS